MIDNLKIYFNPTKLSSKHSYSTSGRTDNDRDDELIAIKLRMIKNRNDFNHLKVHQIAEMVVF